MGIGKGSGGGSGGRFSGGGRLSGFLIWCFAAAGLAGAYQWPVSAPRVVKNFASPRDGEFFAGLRLAVEGKGAGARLQQPGTAAETAAGTAARDVHPVDQGEILFRQAEGYREKPFSGGGSMTVVHHKGGLRSFYAGLEFTGERLLAGSGADDGGPSESGTVTPYSILGRPASGQEAFRFYLYDTQRERFVNPFLVLPPFRDEEAPRLSGLVLVDEGGQTYPLRGDRLEPAVYRLRGRVSDRIGGESAGAATVPYSISLFLNGNAVRTVTFDALEVQGGEWVLASLKEGRYSEVYGPGDSFVLGNMRLNTGRNILEIILRDIAGNETVRTYRIEVR